MPTTVRNHLTALRALLVLTVVLGIAYPLAVTGVSQLAFAGRANGSIVTSDGKEVGSSLLGQTFTLAGTDQPDPRWYQPRPSAGSYDPKASGASNLGPDSEVLLKSVEERRAAVAAFDGVDPASVPADALTASGSGLDPHVSEAYARQQSARVSRERGIPVAELDRLVEKYTEGPALGFLGQAGVNVVLLNKALAEHK